MRYEPDRAVETLSALLAERADRDRLVALLDRLLADKRIQQVEPTADQTAMLERVRGVLGSGGSRKPRVVAAR